MIGVKEFRHQLPKVLRAVTRGERFTIVRYAKPIAMMSPIPRGEKKKYTMKDLLDLRFTFKTKDKNLSKKVDQIVYGV